MMDPVREYLDRRGARPDLVAGGLAGLVRLWEQIGDDVARGYQLTLDDYRNDLDVRDLLAGALAAAAPAERDLLAARIEEADRRFVDATEPGASVWPDDHAGSGEHATSPWWYTRRPRKKGPALSRDLDR